jgi:hypothetical protein
MSREILGKFQKNTKIHDFDIFTKILGPITHNVPAV